MNCKICTHPTEKIFSKKILLKYDADYFRCTNCGFMQTEEPFWLKEAYNSAITSLDIGILDRNKFLLREIPKIIDSCFPEGQIFLDFAGGYGLFVRSMRDLGFNFFRQDFFCENIFANHFDLEDSATKQFDAVTAFEVFEHLENPLPEIENILSYSENIIFSTDIIPDDEKIEDWIYIAHETGQHIAFYTEKSLRIVAEKFGKNYYRKKNLHVFTNKTFTQEQLDYAFHDNDLKKDFWATIKKKNKKFIIRRESYQHRDYLKIKEILKRNA